MAAVPIDDFVFIAAACGGRAHSNRIELALGADVLLQQPKLRIILLEAGLQAIRKLARADLLWIEAQHHHAGLALGF